MEGELKMKCAWIYGADQLMIDYHDKEWGRPLHDERGLFELLCLEGLQAGLSWKIVLNKREFLRKAFDNFEVEKISQYTSDDVEKLLTDPKIIRNKRKIEAIINNAKIVNTLYERNESLDSFFWGIIDNQPIINNFKNPEEIPTKTQLSEQISKTLKKMGFKFVGPTIIYSFMEASGMVNDHLVGCYGRNYKRMGKNSVLNKKWLIHKIVS